MTKKESNLLGLGSLTQSETGIVFCGTVANFGRPLSATEQRIAMDAQTQMHIIRWQREKAEAAIREVAQAHRQGANEFQETLSHLQTLKEAARGKEYQALVEEYNQRSQQMVAQHLFGILEVTARNIGMETARSLHRDEPPRVIKVVEKRGFFQRLLGEGR